MNFENVYVQPQLIAPAGSGAATWSVSIKNAGSVAIKSVAIFLFNGSSPISNISYIPATPLASGQEATITQFGGTLISPLSGSQRTSMKAGEYSALLTVTNKAGQRGVFNISLVVVNTSSLFGYVYLMNFGNKSLAVANLNYTGNAQNYYLVIWDKTTGTQVAYTNVSKFGFGRFSTYVLGNATAYNTYYAYVGLNSDSPSGIIYTGTITPSLKHAPVMNGILFPFFRFGKGPITATYEWIMGGGSGYKYTMSFLNETNIIGMIAPLIGDLNGSNVVAGASYNYEVIIAFANGENKTITGSVTATAF